MKPIKLEMSAFGAYADRAEIDFTRYAENGLFLITGPTGSGKTTIFDGISFALFGEASGEYRNAKHLRSDYADEDADTYVKFTFEHQGHTYVIRRFPEYERKKKRGEGTITNQEKAMLSKDGGVPVEGLKKVNDAVTDLLNVDYKQFKQIAMIAQGEFYNLLNASTDDRTKILRSIFLTDGYKQIEGKLRDYAGESSKAMQEASRSVGQYFDDVQVDEDYDEPQYTGARETYKNLQEKKDDDNSAWNIDTLLNAILELVEADKKYAAALKEDADRKNKEADEANGKLKTATENNNRIDEKEQCERDLKAITELDAAFDGKQETYQRHAAASHEIRPVYDKYRETTSQLQSSQDAVNKLQKELEEAHKNAKASAEALNVAKAEEDKASSAENAAHLIERDRDDYAIRENLQKKITELSRSEENIKSDLQKSEEKQNALNQKIIELEQVQTDLKEAPLQAEKKNNEINQMEDLQNTLVDLTGTRFVEYKSAEEALKKAQETYKDSRTAYDSAQDEANQAERLLEFCRAGILAEDLEEGKPCPVCGSVHHPHKAFLPEHSVTEDEVKRLKEQSEKARSVSEQANTEAARQKVRFDSMEQTLTNELKNALGNKILKDSYLETTDFDWLTLLDFVKLAQLAVDDLTDEIKADREAYEKLQKNIRDLKSAEEEIQTKREELKAVTASLDDQKKKSEDIATRLSASKGQIVALKKLPYENWKAAEMAMSIFQTQAKTIRERIQTADQNKKIADEAVAGTESALKEQKEHLGADRTKQQKSADALHGILEKYHYASEEELLPDLVTEDVLKQENEEIQKHAQIKTAAQAKYEQAVKNAEGRKWEDTESLKTTWEELSNEAKELQTRQTLAETRVRTNQTIYQKIDAQKDGYEASRKKNNTANRLYKLVSGQTGKGKITFEQYVQAEGFDGIIRAANRRLFRMSSGRYELSRQQDALGKRTNTFLDLDVLDNFTGRKRPVSTLSGGESFDASLSLALGLSDTISANLGGIQIDALFVDEGFGTLDKDSINSVLGTLIDLSNASKLVGVISHREELAEVIPQKIVVEKSASGSHIRFEDSE